MQLERWQSLMSSLGFSANESTYCELVAAYSEKGRHYHSQAHIDACLRHLDRCKSLAESADEIELALWFHDAIYKPFRSDNEFASAEWAKKFMAANRMKEQVLERVYRLIMVTEHNAPTKTLDESLLVDIDLSILGVNAAEYDRFEANVRKEYKRVPLVIYRNKRAEVLTSFLERPVIYNNEPFHSELESNARENLSNAIDKLRS